MTTGETLSHDEIERLLSGMGGTNKAQDEQDEAENMYLLGDMDRAKPIKPKESEILSRDELNALFGGEVPSMATLLLLKVQATTLLVSELMAIPISRLVTISPFR